MTDLFRLDGRVALVTGAARGLGRGLALALAAAGADLALLDVRAPEETCAAVAALGRRAHPIAADLSGLTPERAAALVAEAAGALGRLDILVNNAGITRRAPALEYAAADWHAVLDVQLNAVFFLAQAAARRYVDQTSGGKIINIASMLSFQGGVLIPPYTAAKSAVAGITRALANEWAALGINVNAIAPGYMATEITAAIRDDPQRDRAILERIPAGRWGEPEDLAGAVVFLASEAARYVHGTILPVDGGWLAR